MTEPEKGYVLRLYPATIEFPYLVSYDWWGAKRDKIGSILTGPKSRALRMTSEDAQEVQRLIGQGAIEVIDD